MRYRRPWPGPARPGANAARGEADFLSGYETCPYPFSDLSSARTTSIRRVEPASWSETEKLATFIVDNRRARIARGSAFMGGRKPNSWSSKDQGQWLRLRLADRPCPRRADTPYTFMRRSAALFPSRRTSSRRNVARVIAVNNRRSA
jgi:hypothetical protein